MDVDTFNLAPYVIYYASLLACIPLATCYKAIEDAKKKRNFGVSAGFFIALALCGPYIIYTFLLVAGNIVIIKSCQKEFVHHVSLLSTWMLLIYLHFFVGCPVYTNWLLQMMSLRLVGLAFEVKLYDKASADQKKMYPECITELSALDIASYAYFFVGLHRGPYYSWKCYNDHLTSLMSTRGDFRAVTEQKIKKAAGFALLYWLIWLKYPYSIYEQEEFYVNYSTDYRFLCTFPHLIMYFLESQIVLMISTSGSTEAGFGVYPKKCLAVPGGGPTVLCKLTGEESLKDEYNFAMLKCFENEQILMGPKMRDTVRGWDLSIRYWFHLYILKNCLHSNFEVRSANSFLFWTIWIGPNLQNIIKSMTLWVYIQLESEYANLFSDTLQGPCNFGFAIMRLLCLIYLTPCYVIDDTSIAIRYYNSIYWVYHIVLIILTVVAILLQTHAKGLSFVHSVCMKPDSMQVVDSQKKVVSLPAATSQNKPVSSAPQQSSSAPDQDIGKPPESGSNEGGATISANKNNENIDKSVGNDEKNKNNPPNK